MSNIQQVDWMTIRPASVVGLRRGYIVLPAFSYSTAFAGASEIVAQYGYTVGSKFTLKTVPSAPVDATYVLCIRYRVGTTVTRFKLWGGVGEVMPGVPLYNGEVIRQNFVLEIWNTQNYTTVSDSARTIYTSIGTVPTDYRTSTAIEQSSSTEIYPLVQQETAVALPTDGLMLHFKADTIGDETNWVDSIAGINLEPYGSPSAPLVVTDAVNGYAALYFNDDDIMMRQVGSLPTSSNLVFFLFVKHLTVVDNQQLFTYRDAGNTAQAGIIQSGTAGVAGFSGGSVTTAQSIDINEWQVLKAKITRVAGGKNNVVFAADEQGNTAAVEAVAAALDTIHLGDNTGVGALFYIAELAVYDTLVLDEVSIRRYFGSKFKTSMQFPLVFPDGSAWNDNNS